MAQYELLGTTSGCIRVLLKGNLASLRRQAKSSQFGGDTLKHYAIYQVYNRWGRFHNATDERFLVEHWQDPYWLNRGVSSV